MAIFTLAEIEAQMAAYKEALMALSLSKEYTAGGKTLKREDLPEIRKTLAWLEEERQGLSSGTGKLYVNVGMVRR